MSYDIRIVECPNNPEHRIEPLVSGKGYSEWVCLDCGEQFKELFPAELKDGLDNATSKD